MAKRFTDTDKWKKKFIRGLDAPYKVFWLYILDDCNHAGVWDVDIDVAKIRSGCDFNEESAIDVFGNKIIVFDDGEKWFIPDFIEFQYGTLNPKNRVHESVISLLTKYENKGLVRGLLDPKDKDKEKDKIKDKEKAKTDFDLQKIIDIYNSVCNKLPQVEKLTTQRKQAINSRVKEYSLAKIGDVIQKTADSKFMNGENEQGWTASFDWIMKPANFIKILEGNYDNKNISNGTTKNVADNVRNIIERINKKQQ